MDTTTDIIQILYGYYMDITMDIIQILYGYTKHSKAF